MPIRRGSKEPDHQKEGVERVKVCICPSCGKLLNCKSELCEYCGFLLENLPEPEVEPQPSVFHPTTLVFLICAWVYTAALFFSALNKNYSLMEHFWSPDPKLLQSLGASSGFWAFAEGECWRLFTYGLLHDHPLQFVVSLALCAYLGTMLTHALGKRRFFLSLMICNVLGGSANCFTELLGIFSKPATGLIAADFGFMVILYFYCKKHQYDLAHRRMKWILIVSHFLALALALSPVVEVDYFICLFGSVAGLLLSLWFETAELDPIVIGVERVLLLGGLAFLLFGLSRLLEA